MISAVEDANNVVPFGMMLKGVTKRTETDQPRGAEITIPVQPFVARLVADYGEWFRTLELILGRLANDKSAELAQAVAA